jgi:hypothetical protein
MIQLDLISVRPMTGNVDRFHTSDNGILEYIKKNFQDTGKLVSMSTTISEDYSTQIRTLVFASNDDYNFFIKDDVLQYQSALRNRYNTYHNINFNEVVKEL